MKRVGIFALWLMSGSLGCATTEEPLQPYTHAGSAGIGGSSGGSGGTSGAGGGCNANGASSGQGASSGLGASSGQGASPGCGGSAGTETGGSGGTPATCDDSEKHCQHVFSYPAGGETSVELRGDFSPDGWKVGVPLALSGATWSATVEVPYQTDVAYKFLINGSQWATDPQNPNLVSDGLGGQNSLLSGVTCSDWTCVATVTGSFDWRDAVLYFVFVDRFSNGNSANDGAAISGVDKAAAYQGGDWAGVRQKIKDGYFTDLGVNVLWLSAPMDNPGVAGAGTDNHLYSAYHGYWPSKLDSAEEHFGSLDELVGLVDEAHAAGLRVILDYAMNHVHVSSPVYQTHADWFWPIDYNGKKCICGEGCGWDGAEGKRCWFRDYLPDFNFTIQSARDFSVANALSWIKNTGIDGFRLDAVKHIEDSWVTDLRSRVTSEIEATSGEHFYMVGETFTPDRDTIKYYVDPTTKLDGQFDFPLRAKLVASLLLRSTPLTDLDSFLSSNQGYYGAGIMSTFVGNHDVPRSIHFAEDNPLWGNEWADGKDRAWSNQPGLPSSSSAFERLANAYTLLFTIRGVPMLYYGDEVGMPGAGDPDNRRMMQFTSYSSAQQTLHSQVKKLAAIRAAHPALRRGKRTTLSAANDTLAYRMDYNADSVTVVINRSDASQTANGLASQAYEDLLTGQTVNGPNPSLPPRSSRVLVAK